jgi:hypothetical protein
MRRQEAFEIRDGAHRMFTINEINLGRPLTDEELLGKYRGLYLNGLVGRDHFEKIKQVFVDPRGRQPIDREVIDQVIFRPLEERVGRFFDDDEKLKILVRKYMEDELPIETFYHLAGFYDRCDLRAMAGAMDRQCVRNYLSDLGDEFRRRVGLNI